MASPQLPRRRPRWQPGAPAAALRPGRLRGPPAGGPRGHAPQPPPGSAAHAQSPVPCQRHLVALSMCCAHSLEHRTGYVEKHWSVRGWLALSMVFVGPPSWLPVAVLRCLAHEQRHLHRAARLQRTYGLLEHTSNSRCKLHGCPACTVEHARSCAAPAYTLMGNVVRRCCARRACSSQAPRTSSLSAAQRK